MSVQRAHTPHAPAYIPSTKSVHLICCLPSEITRAESKLKICVCGLHADNRLLLKLLPQHQWCNNYSFERTELHLGSPSAREVDNRSTFPVLGYLGAIVEPSWVQSSLSELSKATLEKYLGCPGIAFLRQKAKLLKLPRLGLERHLGCLRVSFHKHVGKRWLGWPGIAVPRKQDKAPETF
jgi:hypothetical protein